MGIPQNFSADLISVFPGKNLIFRGLFSILYLYRRIFFFGNKSRKGGVYNGKEKWAKEKILKLSDAFVIQDEDPAVELKVKVININPEQKHEILERCRVLKEYSIFIDTIRRYQDMGEEEPYRKAIEECIEKDVLADYLRKKGSEVVNMLMSEYNYEQDIEVQREEAYEEGRKSGIVVGEERYNKLVQLLIESNRLEDLKKVTEDVNYRSKLLKEFHIE